MREGRNIELTRGDFLKLGGAFAGVGALGLAGCGGGGGGGQGGGGGGKKYKIALSNSYIGNQWRIEMVNLYKAALKMAPYKSQVEGTVLNSGNEVSQQTQQISNLISQRVDAILVDAASPTGLNGIIEQAASQGILVVSFDNTVTTKKALQANTDQFQFGEKLASWLANKLGGKGNVIMVTGVPGTYVDQQRNKGAESVWKRTPA